MNFCRKCSTWIVAPLLSVSILISSAFGAEALPTRGSDRVENDILLVDAEFFETTDRLPGVDLAQGISQITGVAISPLLAVSTIGAWQYWRTPEHLRGGLPWFSHPLAWGIGLSILLLCFFKDTIGAAAPTIIKKPLDLIELFENKASAVVASAAFVPFVANQIAVHFAAEKAVAPMAVSGAVDGTFLASIPFLADLPLSSHWFLVPICLLGFFLVWIVSHAINVLIILSPFRIVDAFLKVFRLGVLSTMMALYAISPILAAILSCAILAVAAFLAPSAFRLCVFGTVMGTDYLRSLIWKEKTPTAVRGFLAKQGSKRLKARSFGKLHRDKESGEVKFVSRFLFFGHRRILKIAHPETLAVAKGLLFPSILRNDEETGKQRLVIYLLPGHRHHIDEVAAELGIGEVRETVLVRGFLAMKGWLVDTVRSGKGKLLEGGGSSG